MERSPDPRAAILDAACRLFTTRGYHAVGVQEICDAAGVKKGSFYHFFPSKSDLALHMLDTLWEHVREAEFHPFARRDLSPLARFALYFEIAPRAFAELRMPDGALCGCPFGNMALEMSTHDEPIRQKLEAIYGEWTGFYEAALREAVEAGELEADVDPAGLAETLVALMSGAALLAKTHNSLDFADRLREQAWRLIRPRKAA